MTVSGDPGLATRILFFGRLGELLGREIVFDLPAEGCTIAALRSALAADDPRYAALDQPGIRVAVDQVVVNDRHAVMPGQEIAFFPPLSGG